LPLAVAVFAAAGIFFATAGLVFAATDWAFTTAGLILEFGMGVVGFS
jgi:hypothetical protein